VSISPSQISLLVAASNLNEVQGVIAAMRAADAASRPGRGPLGIEPVVEPRKVIHPEPRYEARQVIHPTPRIELRPVIHPGERGEGEKRQCEKCFPPQVVAKMVEAQEQPLPAPWKTVPWKNPLPPASMIKVAPFHPDMRRKGTILDVFI
jgi:hypothetical protein